MLYYELGVEVRVIWVVDIRLSKLVLEFLSRIVGVLSLVFVLVLYFCCICMFVYFFRLYRFLFYLFFVDFLLNVCYIF